MASLRAYSRGLSFPGQQPRGPSKIDWGHPITNGLSLFWNFSDGTNRPTFTDNGTYDGSNLVVKPTLGLNQSGVGITTALISDTSTYILPQSKGTFVSQLVLNFSPADGVDHGSSCQFDTSVGTFFGIRKYADNNWYVGWQSGTDTRIVASATGSFVKGEAFSAAITWNAANSSFYTKGILRGTNASAPATGSTSARQFFANSDSLAGDSSFIYSAAWNRELSASELALLNADPYCFLIPAEAEMPALFVAAGGFTPSYRKTLSSLGTRIGARQNQAA